MTEKEANRILDSTWLAVKKGDKKVAGEYLRKLGFEVLMGEELDRTDRLRLGWALMHFKDDPVAFFGFSRRGPSSTKTIEKLVVWAEVKILKDELRKDGQKQVDAFAVVAENLHCSERKVRSISSPVIRLSYGWHTKAIPRQ